MTTPAFEEEFECHVRACSGFLFAITQEEERFVRKARSICERLERDCVTFDIADGFRPCGRISITLPSVKEPLAALEYIEKVESRGAFILLDAHEYCGNALVKRKLRSVGQRLKYSRKLIIGACPSADDIPKELRADAHLIMVPPPTVLELSALLDHLNKSLDVKKRLPEAAIVELVYAAAGLTESGARKVFASVLVKDKSLNGHRVQYVATEKARMLAQASALQIQSPTQTMNDLGGFAELKHWIMQRKAAFTQDGKEYGLPAPRGLLLLGPPGVGKSFAAGGIAHALGVPLVRLDVGAIFGSLVGQSEEQMRVALQQAETIGDVVLWIDELEKCFTQDSLDSGTSRRVFATFLTWLSEKTSAVFVVTTANDISKLPPELLRKGRFDEIFFLDLPSLSEREEILAARLRSHGRDPRDFDINRIARVAAGYVGSEIEQAIVEAMHRAFPDGGRQFTSEDIIAAIKSQIPLSASNAEAIQTHRRWLQEGRARSASSPSPNGTDEDSRRESPVLDPL